MTGHVLFGLDPGWASTALLIVTYATIMTESLNRAGGRRSMISLGIRKQAVEGIGGRAGVRFRFLELAKIAFALLVSIAVSHAYLEWRFQ